MNIIQRCQKARDEFYKKHFRLPTVIVLGKTEQTALEDFVYAENKAKELQEQEYARKYKHAYIQPVLHDPNKVDTVYGMKLKRTNDETLLEVYLA